MTEIINPLLTQQPSNTEQRKQLQKFLETDYKDKILDSIHTGKLTINHALMDIRCMEMAEQVLHDYKKAYNIIQEEVQNIMPTPKKIKIQFSNVHPILPISEIHQKYNGDLVSFEGTVKKKSRIFNEITRAVWSCNNCGADIHRRIKVGEELYPPKTVCPTCNAKHGYTLDKKHSTFQDVQQLIIQEPLDQMEGSIEPANIKCILLDEMVDSCIPGDNVQINGLLDLRNKGKKNVFQEYVTVKYIEHLEQEFNDLEVTTEEEKKIKELAQRDDIFSIIRNSTAPSIYGYEELKDALALHLFGSDSVELDDGTKMRGDIHLLIMGDPGIGKSQILKYVSQLAPRGIYTSGKGSSGAGLTAAAVKDDMDSWSLEAGAMVLGDKGNVCIDELDKMNEQDRSAIHEALEQQTISISKAGITTTLNSRCSVLAAANPKLGRFDPYKAFKDQVTLSPTILSRFDLIFMVTDNADKTEDEAIARKILELRSMREEDTTSLDTQLLRKYISYARQNIHPKLTPEAVNEITQFYVRWRELAVTNNHPIPITARQLEAISRLAMASARIRLSDKVSVEDAKRATQLQEYCLKHVGFDVESGQVDSDLINVGISKSERDTKTEMLNLFKELADEWGNNIPNHVLMEEFQNKGYNKKSVQAWLKEMAKDMFLYDTVEEKWSILE